MAMTIQERNVRRADRTRTDILDGAAEAFGSHGYSQTSVQRIIDAAGVTRRTFYRYFRSKDDVFAALLDARVDELCAHIDDAPDEPSIRRRLEVRIAGMLDVAYANRTFMRAIAEAIHVHPAHAERWSRMRRVIEDRNRAAISWCVDKGFIDRIDTAVARLLSVTSEAAVLDLATDDTFDARAIGDAVVDMYWNTLFRPYEGADDYLLRRGLRPEPVRAAAG